LAVGFALPHKAQAAAASFDKATVYTLCEIEHPPDLGLCWLRVAMAGPIDEAGKSVTKRQVKVLRVRTQRL
ncbi:hypothetical protein JY412_15095, partial [Stenotrophomonas maltophilia]|nr:hypothetical protein [Stenotrophomonas maltophilia]